MDSGHPAERRPRVLRAPWEQKDWWYWLSAILAIAAIIAPMEVALYVL